MKKSGKKIEKNYPRQCKEQIVFFNKTKHILFRLYRKNKTISNYNIHNNKKNYLKEK